MDEPKHTILQVLEGRWWIILPAFAASLIATPIFRAVAYRFKIVDRPDDLLKPHGRSVAYLGGLGIWMGMMIGLGSYLLTLPDLGAKWSGAIDDLASFRIGHLLGLTPPQLAGKEPSNPLWNLIGVMLASTVIMVVGLLDDLKNLRPKQKIAGQVLAAGILMAGGIGLRIANLIFTTFGFRPEPWLFVPLSVVLCLVFVIGACNATNLLDGLDGLCGGVTGIISLGFLALAVWLAMWGYHPGIDELRIGLALAMVGAVLGFLPYNVPPASIFMGDAGSMLLGFFVASMMALFCREGNARWLLAALVVYSLPILDTALALVRRRLSGTGIFAGDRSHLYDQLIDRGMSVRQVVGLFYVLSIGAAVLGVSVALWIWLQTRYALIIYAVLLAAVWCVFWKAGMIHPAPHAHKPINPPGPKSDKPGQTPAGDTQ
jgi:UDP-GlcNAc:undecaprenyl-phosphate GlcNAc-1-phosphate transferase